MKQYGILYILLFVTLTGLSQQKKDLELIRDDFQNIKNEEDVKAVIGFQIRETNETEVNVLKAYKGAAQCMIAKYVFSPLSKLKNFKEGKKVLEASISENMNVENIYLRLMIQLNVPKNLNYYKNIDGDIEFLEAHMSKATIDLEYKKLMIKNLIGVTKKEERKDSLLDINLIASS